MADLKSWMYKRKSIQFKSQQNSKSKTPRKTKQIAFLVDGRVDRNLKVIKSYIDTLEKRGKNVSLLFLTDHTDPDQISFQAFNKKAFSWYMFPKSQDVLNFIEHRFDILFCLNMDDVAEINIVNDLSLARFKIGMMPMHKEGFDLLINPKTEKNWEEYIQTLENTLSQLSLSPVLV